MGQIVQLLFASLLVIMSGEGAVQSVQWQGWFLLVSWRLQLEKESGGLYLSHFSLNNPLHTYMTFNTNGNSHYIAHFMGQQGAHCSVGNQTDIKLRNIVSIGLWNAKKHKELGN